MAITWLASVLREANLTVIEVDGWRNRARPGTFAPQGVLVHHTGSPVRATDANPAPSKQTVINGRSDLAGPLCHVLVDWRGRCHVIAAGRANHAGEARASGPMPAGDGNALYVGIEVDYSAFAVDPPQYRSNVQQMSTVVATAAILKRLGSGFRKARAHKETSVTGKTDPWPWDMEAFRTGVQNYM